MMWLIPSLNILCDGHYLSIAMSELSIPMRERRLIAV
jgi:hypothetical protein